MIRRLFHLAEAKPSASIDAQAFALLCHEHPDQAKRHVLQAYRQLLDEYESLFEPLQQRIQLAIDRLRRLPPDLLEHEGQQFFFEEQKLRRACMRLRLSQEETQPLLAEWHDWLRHAHGGMRVTEAIRERMELLRSELASRGVPIKLPVFSTATQAPSMTSSDVQRAAPAVTLQIKQSHAAEKGAEQVSLDSEGDEFREWRERADQRQKHQQAYWTKAFHVLCASPFIDDQEQAMEVVRMYRRAHE